MIVPITETVHPDEKAWRLKELNVMRLRGKVNEMRRIQTVWVQRNGVIYEWSRDLGPATRFSNPGCDVPSLWEHTVGELWDIAETHRLKDNHWIRFMDEKSHESTLFEEWRNQVMERHEIINNRSVNGPKHRKQRIGFPRRLALVQ